MSIPIQIAIVDDEEIQLDTMKSLIAQASAELGLFVELSYFSSGEAFLFELEDHPGLDIVFLDIEMDRLTGLEVAQKIRETNQELTLIFATAFAEYAIEGYSVQALDYLLKPIEVEKVKRVFQKHLKRKPQLKHFVTIESTKGEIMKLFEDDILYIEVNRRECEIHLIEQVVFTRQTLKELSDKLSESFISTHRSYLVNLSHIERLLKTDVELTNGSVVPLSRRLAKDVQDRFVHHHKGSVFYEE